jgi:alkylation response protein AidB-like acyl-CoA dehydrogenase
MTSSPTEYSPEPTTADIARFRAGLVEALHPLVSEADRWECDGHLPRELFEVLGRMGIFRERWRCGPLGGLPLARAMVEELAVRNAGAALATSLHSEVFLHALTVYGDDRHQATREAALDGLAVGCTAITEASGGSDVPGSVETSAVRDRDGWRVCGTKRFITNAGRATHALVLAKGGLGAAGFTLFLVPLDHPGVTVTGFFRTLGMRSVDTGAIELDTALPDQMVVGPPGAGLGMMLRMLDFERLAAATGLVAGARHTLRLAAAYMRQRTQFGKRLFDHQALRHRLADSWVQVESAAALVDRASQPKQGRLAHYLVAAAKLATARACGAAVDESLQIFGGRGYTEAYRLERYYRDSRLIRIGGGTDEIMREIIAARLDAEDEEIETLLSSLAQADVARVDP